MTIAYTHTYMHTLQVALTKEVELEYSRERALQPNYALDMKSRPNERSPQLGPSTQLGSFPQSNGHTITSHR